MLHNGQTSDPMNRFSKDIKEISSKRKKTDADFQAMAKLEWFSSLYLSKEGKVIFPSICLDAGLIAASRTFREGKKAQAGLFTTQNAIVKFDGDNLSMDDLFLRDENRTSMAVRIQQAKIIRTRFSIEENWKFIWDIAFEDTLLDLDKIVQIVKVCGDQIGLFEMRPRMGRFESEVMK